MKRLLLILLVGWLCAVPQAAAQSDDSAAELKELRTLVERLQAENALLRERLKASAPTGDKPIQESPDAKNAAGPKRRPSALEAQISELTSRLDALRTEREIARKLRVEQFESLDHELARLKKMEEEAIQSSDDAMLAAPAVVQALLQRMAEAQVENRLRMHETKALVEALKNRRDEVAKKCREEAQLAIEKAALLIDQRRAELQMVREELAAAGNTAVRNELEMKMRQAMSRIAKAEVMRDEAESRRESVSRELDERLAEATIEAAVSQSVQRALAEEVPRTRRLLAAGSELSQIKIEKEALQNQLIKIKLAIGDEQRSHEAEISLLQAKLQWLEAQKNQSEQPK